MWMNFNFLGEKLKYFEAEFYYLGFKLNNFVEIYKITFIYVFLCMKERHLVFEKFQKFHLKK